MPRWPCWHFRRRPRPKITDKVGCGPGGLPPHEIVTILRSTGLDPLGQPVRRGPNWRVWPTRAIDEKDREVSVVVSARSGDVLSVTPVQTASRMPPPRGGLTLGPYERMPPGYTMPPAMPPGGYRAGAPVVDEDDEPNISGNPNAPRPPGALPGAPPMRSSNAAPLPPRGGAMPPDDDDASPPSEPNVITADPDRSGLLPPPPERFPQRAAPPAPPKPVKRAAAAPPSRRRCPKPKPRRPRSTRRRLQRRRLRPSLRRRKPRPPKRRRTKRAGKIKAPRSFSGALHSLRRNRLS